LSLICGSLKWLKDFKENQQKEVEKSKTRLIKEGGGNKPKLSEEEQIILMLVYLRHYLSFQLLGIMFKISESSVHNIFNYWQSLFEGNLLESIEVGTSKGLQQIHSYLFGGLYEFAGQIRQKNISKGGFQFANARFLDDTLKRIEQMSESNFDEIVDKYVEMNVAHPFMEGNGRSSRIWLDLMLKKNIEKCVDWSKIGKNEYMEAMRASTTESSLLKELLINALTKQINNRELFMKGIDYSYYYEENN
jgi:cell filamentation protein